MEKEITKYEALKDIEKELIIVTTLEDIIEYTKEHPNAFAYIKGSFDEDDTLTFEGHVEKGQVYIDKLFDKNGKEMKYVGIEEQQNEKGWYPRWETMKI